MITIQYGEGVFDLHYTPRLKLGVGQVSQVTFCFSQVGIIRYLKYVCESDADSTWDHADVSV